MKKTALICYGGAFVFSVGILGVLIYYAYGISGFISMLFVEKVPALWIPSIYPFALLFVIYFSLKGGVAHPVFLCGMSCLIVSHILYEAMKGPSIFLIPLLFLFVGITLDLRQTQFHEKSGDPF
jgi:hypothetical protein